MLDFGFTHTSLSWRLMLSVAAIPAVLQMVAMFHLPESPRWYARLCRGVCDSALMHLMATRLAHYGRIDEAKETMGSLMIDPDDKVRSCVSHPLSQRSRVVRRKRISRSWITCTIGQST